MRVGPAIGLKIFGEEGRNIMLENLASEISRNQCWKNNETMLDAIGPTIFKSVQFLKNSVKCYGRMF